MPTSPRNHGAPVPSTIRPLVISTSIARAALSRLPCRARARPHRNRYRGRRRNKRWNTHVGNANRKAAGRDPNAPSSLRAAAGRGRTLRIGCLELGNRGHWIGAWQLPDCPIDYPITRLPDPITDYPITRLPDYPITRSRGRSALSSVHRLSADHRPVHLDVHDLVGVDVVRILLQHDEVGQLPGGDRPLQRFLRRGVGAVDRADGERLGRR